MRLAFSRSCALAIVFVACVVLAGPALAASTPINLTATARSDHLIELSWAWPASPTYPDELDVYRDGVFASTVSPVTATSFQDTNAGNPGTSHTYYLVPVSGGQEDLHTPTTAPAVLRGDAPSKPTNVDASFAAGTSNLATVTWTRGAMDADVTYTVTAQQVGGGPLNTRTVKYPDPGTAGALTMDVFASYTSYVFKVSAVEDVGDPPGDAGGTVAADASVTRTSFDVIPPQLPAGSLSATRTSLGTITVNWSPATDAGSGVDYYIACVDGITCKTVPFSPLDPSASADVTGIPNDGALHPVSVVAYDKGAPANASSALTVSIVMPIPATPVIALQGGNGCMPLVATPTSSDPGSTYHLYLDGSSTETSSAGPITGAPYQQVTLTARATAGVTGADLSLVSNPIAGRIEDPDGPDTAPQVHGQADSTSGSETLFWDPVPQTVGAPLIKYVVTSNGIPGYENGVDVPLSSQPNITISGLAAARPYAVAVTAVDACNRSSPPSSFAPFRLNDTQAPTAPVLNTPVATGSTVTLSWAPSTDDTGVDDYTILVNGVARARTPLTTYTFTGLDDYTTASYQVRATDTVGNPSALSAPRTATTKDTTPPNPPGVVNVKVADGSATVTWSAATDNVAVVGYQILRDGVVIQNVPASTLTYVDKNVLVGDHRWDVRAYDAANLLSTSRSALGTSTGTPPPVIATIQFFKTSGSKSVKVGGPAGARIVLSFTIPKNYISAYLRLNLLKVVASKAKAAKTTSKGTAKPKVKLRVSLPLSSSRTPQAGKRLAERLARKGTLLIPLGVQKLGTLRLVVTATGGVLTLAGTSSGAAKAPTIQTKS